MGCDNKVNDAGYDSGKLQKGKQNGMERNVALGQAWVCGEAKATISQNTTADKATMRETKLISEFP